MVNWAHIPVRRNRPLSGSVAGVSLCHARRGPAAELCEVDFGPTISQPVVHKGVTQLVGMNDKPGLSATPGDHLPDSCG
jgi:hypothetical protein